MEMTLDEAIKHAEEVAEENEESLRGWKECINRGTVGWLDFDKEKVDTSITRCSKCASEHRQLAEWLKDYKRLKEQKLCEDAISRQDVLDLAKKGVLVSNGNYKSVCKAINDLPPVNPQVETEWIPVSERLPEEDGQYLITVKYKPEADYENIYAEHGEWIDERWDMFCFGHCGEVEGIVAWMPLPKPYEPQERSGEK